MFSFLPNLRGAAMLAATLVLPEAVAYGQAIEVTVRQGNSQTANRTLPPGATAAFTVAIRNSGKEAAGPVELTARFESLQPVKSDSWRTDGAALKAEVPSVAAGTTAEVPLRLRVEKAPLESSEVRVTVEAKSTDGTVSSGDGGVRIADCAGAYRARLASLRENLTQPVRDKADEIRKADASLPAGRLFPATGARGGELARGERLAAVFATRRGADPQMSTEWFRFMIARWVSELNAYASQAPNPGLCANNYYQIAGYRQGLLPVTKHLDGTRTAAESALEAVRKEASMETASLGEVVRALAKEAQADGIEDGTLPLSVLASARNALAKARAEPALSRKLSMAETAAWLAETDSRGRALLQTIEGVLGEIAKAHKETCVCAF
jgi:hypothetical protein